MRTVTCASAPSLLVRVVLAACIVGFAVSPATAAANHEGPPLSVSLAAERSEVTIPESIELDAAADRHVYGTGYSIVIVDQDGQRVGDICSNTECPASRSTAWSENANPQPQTFHAELRDPAGTVVATSDNVTVEVRKFVWNVTSVVANPQVGVVTGSVNFLATVDRSVYGTGYRIRIYRDGSELYESCGSGTQCPTSISRGWADNVLPQPGRVRVEVRGPSGDLASNVVEAEAPFRRLIFPVGLSFSSYTNASGIVVHEATATTYRSMYGTSYRLKIKRADGTELCSVNNNDFCRAKVAIGATYRGVVEDSQGRNFGDSGAWTLNGDGPVQGVIDDVDLAYVAGQFASAEAICTALIPYPGTHLMQPPSSTTDQWRVCVASAAAGKNKLDVLRDIAHAVGGAASLAALWYLQREGVRPSPPPGTPWTPDDVEAPRPVPLPFVPQVNKLADILVQQNPTLSQPIADEIAWQCQWMTATVGMNARHECSGQPIFVSGNDVSAATEHDIEALAHWPAWVALNYRPRSETPGSRSWYESEQECATPQEGLSCDEYPFWATMQGGPFAIKRPHLSMINATHNSRQGGLYGRFVTTCHMNAGDAFLAVPIPTVPTQTRICNGH